MANRTEHGRRKGVHWARRACVAATTAALAMLSISAPVKAGSGTGDRGLGTMSAVVDQIGARDLWERGITGEGVNVAIIDTGVAPVDALVDQVVAVADLSLETDEDGEGTYEDLYGHGTHMAGIIAGRTPSSDPAIADEHPEWFLGVAPDAGIVSVKVAGSTGAADITQVIAGIDWAVDHADELDIGVINLSYSSGSTLGYETDPLAYAVERAWRRGIVVVVAAGNDGRQAHRLASPARDPYVIAVGAAEATSATKFVVPSWAASGDGIRNPDVVAPGAHIDSLRAPGSFADLNHPEGYVTEELFRGSGSSQAAAVVSGAAALLLQARPDLTPDQVKALLMSDTATVSPHLAKFSGTGVIQLAGLVDAEIGDVAQTWPHSDGSGSLDAARGDTVVELDGVPVVGDTTVLGAHWSGAHWSDDAWEGAHWSGGEWDGAHWSGGEWHGAHWSGVRWTGAHWTGVRWSGASWSGGDWSGVRWTGVRWTGAHWSEATWPGAHWSGAHWSGAGWPGAHWSGVQWSGAHWSGAHWSGAHWSATLWG
jgi:serine protease AprX